MKKTRMIALFLAVLLFGLCCAGCTNDSAAVTSPDGTPVRMRNGGKLSFLPAEPLSVPKLSEMVYVRPDAETLIAEIEALTEKIPSCSDAEALLKDYYDIALHMQNFSSMYELAFFRFCMDTSDSYYAAEYDHCDEQSAVLDEKQAALYAAFAASPCRDALEQAYFGEGFFRDYDDFNAGDETYFALKQQENDLLFRYYELAGSADLSSYNGIKRSHEAFGDLFLQLVRVRQQIAAAKGYEDYMDYSYDCVYHRDYSTAQAKEYLAQVRALLAPLMKHQEIDGKYSYYSDWDESLAMDMLSAAAERMGGPVWDSYRFLSGHELYDISYSPDKMAIGYTDYIGNYEAPIIFVDPDAKDLLIALFHEFGHFTDWYRNYGIAGSLETGETYSQSMQYLAFAYADPFTESERTENLRATLSDLLIYSVLREAAYGDFELQVYALPPEELTLENIDGIYGQCMKDYGLAALSGVEYKDIYWSAYNHFFERPGYLISYSISAVSALQICRMEAEAPGAGVEAFCRLLDRTHGKKYAAVQEEAGLDSPFERVTLEKTAEFLKEAFDLN